MEESHPFTLQALALGHVSRTYLLVVSYSCVGPRLSPPLGKRRGMCVCVCGWYYTSKEERLGDPWLSLSLVSPPVRARYVPVRLFRKPGRCPRGEKESETISSDQTLPPHPA